MAHVLTDCGVESRNNTDFESKKFLKNALDGVLLLVDRKETGTSEDRMTKKTAKHPYFSAAQKSQILNMVVDYNLATEKERAEKYTEEWFLNTLRGDPKITDKEAPGYRGILPRNRSADSIWREVNRAIRLLKKHEVGDSAGKPINWISPKRSDEQILEGQIGLLMIQHGLKTVKKKTQ